MSSSNFWLIFNIGGVVLSTFACGFFWNRKPILRKLPIYYGLFSGVIYAFFGQDSHSIIEPLKTIVASLIIGIGFYFSAWIQCKEKGDRFW